MFDEKALRKPAFDETTSAPVVLADGQEWWLPKPWLEVRPVFRGGKAVDTVGLMTAGGEFDALKNAVHDAENDGAIVAAANLAAYMLTRNYDLADEQLSALLGWREGSTWLRDVMRHCAGVNGPKPGSAGGD
jgi:hypothetical protein